MNDRMRLRPLSKRSTQQGDSTYADFPVPKQFFQNDTMQSKGMISKIQQLEGFYYSIQQNNRKERQINHASLIQIQKRLDMLQYKTFSNEKDIKQALDIRTIQTNSNNSSQSYSKNQLNLLKHALTQQRQQHKEQLQHQNSFYEQLANRQMKLQAEMRQMLNNQKSEYDSVLKRQVDEQRSLQHMKQRKIQQQYEMMKNVISNAQRKIYEQLDRKIKNESLVKQFIDEKLEELRQQLISEQKNAMNVETKFIRETKQSLESLFQIIQKIKTQLSQQLAETQKLSAGNIKRVSMSIDYVRQSMSEKLNSLLASQETLEADITQLHSFVTNKIQQNRQIIADIQQVQLQKGQRSIQGSKVMGSLSSDQMVQKIGLLQKQMNQWKNLTQQKNLNVFKQISNTLKSMRTQWKKQNDELTAQLFSMKQSVMTLKKSVPTEIKKSVQTIITIFNNQFDVLAEELDLMSQMIALSKKQNQKAIKQQSKRLNFDIINEIKAMIDQKSKQNSLYTQKVVAKSQQQYKINLDSQSKYLVDLLSQKHQNMENQLTQVASNAKKTNLNVSKQLQDFTVKLKTFNENFKDHLEEQRKDDMRKRLQLQENMRKHANNSMDVTYKKCQFLVEGMKKAMEMNQMKDKLQLDQKVNLIKDDFQKTFLTTKNEIKQQLKQTFDKLHQQRENSEQVLHQAMEQNINNLKRSLTIQMNNLKLQLQQKLSQLRGEDSQKTEQAINSLRQSLWKIQAAMFSQQAKNKAIFDRMGQDIGQLVGSLDTLANELKSN